MGFNIDYMDLVRIIKAFGQDNDEASIIADYLDECIDYDMDLSYYLWNTMLFNVGIVKGGKQQAEKWIDENLCCNVEDCTIYSSDRLGLSYIEY